MAAGRVDLGIQLSSSTKVTLIPREQSYTDFPVTVHVKAPELKVHLQAPVDIVAVLDVSLSMRFDDAWEDNPKIPNKRWEVVKEAMGKVINNLAGNKNRLAIVGFSSMIRESTELMAMTEEGRKLQLQTVNNLIPNGGTNFTIALDEAAQILDNRKKEEKDRLAFIIFLSDGVDGSGFKLDNVKTDYPIHTFGISAQHDPKMLEAMATKTSGSYNPITDDDLEKITEKLDQLSDKLSSIVAVDMRIDLKSLHPGVHISRIESAANEGAGDSFNSEVSADKQSGKIVAGAVSSGKERDFMVYLDVPPVAADLLGSTMELLRVGGVYTQTYSDQEQVAFAESVITVERPLPEPPSGHCKELEWIEERIKYWCKVKQDLSGFYDKAELEAKATVAAAGDKKNKCQCQCQVTKALREASVEATNKAMHHDIYTAIVHILKLRQCSKATAETEGATPSGV